MNRISRGSSDWEHNVVGVVTLKQRPAGLCLAQQPEMPDSGLFFSYGRRGSLRGTSDGVDIDSGHH